MQIEILTKGAEDKNNKRVQGAPKLRFFGELIGENDEYMHISRKGKKLSFSDSGKMLRTETGKPAYVDGIVVQSVPKKIIAVWKEV